MNIRQLRALCEIVKHDLHLSVAAQALHTSQSGVSKQILDLEAELGITIFVRRRNRLIGLSDAGRTLLSIANRTVGDAEMMYAVAADHSSKASGDRSGLGNLNSGISGNSGHRVGPQAV